MAEESKRREGIGAEGMEKSEDARLIREPFRGRDFSYSPYSGFQVGAALLSEDGRIYRGCNIENASYGASNCAERSALFRAVSEGVRSFRKIAIVGGASGSGEFSYCEPCGICRQALAEFCDLESFQVLLARSETDYRILRLGELLPHAFLPAHLSK